MVSNKQFGALGGVFIPTFLSIIGVILFLRLGYIVGTAGVLGATLIILLAVSVIIATGLSLSSIVTNIRVGGGAAYSIIRKTLGLEVSGSVGIPLYLAQVFSVALYIFGFTEAWQFIFPQHPTPLILLCAFTTLFTITAVSAHAAVRAQKIVFGVVIAALISVFFAANPSTGLQVPIQATTTSSAQFWSLFALFFPAVTGLMAGVGLSRRLSDPKKQIPRGVLAALTITTLIYLAVVVWFANVATPEQLINNTDAIATNASIPAIVLAGILAATFSSALTFFTAAPELLSSMANNRVVPFSEAFAKKRHGEPTNAILFSATLLATILALGSLDEIAPILTMFFLLTYALINTSVYLEKTLGNVSFRPTIHVPGFVSLYGALASIFFMFMISTVAAIIAIAFMLFMYAALVHKQLSTTQGDARSGLLRELAEWAAERVNNLPGSNKHNWKPSILLPVITTRTLLGNFPVVKNIVYPNGTMTVLGLKLTSRTAIPEKQEITKKKNQQELEELPTLIDKFREEHVFLNSSVVEVKNYTDGICVSLESIKSQVFSPNILYLSFNPTDLPKENITRIFQTAQRTQTGVLMLDRDEETGIGSQQDLHVWVPESAVDKELYKDHEFDLALLIAYKLYTNWHGTLTLHLSTTTKKARKARNYLRKLIYEARLPADTELVVHEQGDLHKAIEEAASSDLHLMPVQPEHIDDLKKFSAHEGKSWLYCMDGEEDILA